MTDLKAQDKDEFDWVIEDGHSSGSQPIYWGGQFGWTLDHLKAVRFARKMDASSVVRYLDLNIPGVPRIVEHMWSGTEVIE